MKTIRQIRIARRLNMYQLAAALTLGVLTSMSFAGQPNGQVEKNGGPLSIQQLVRVPSLRLTKKDIAGASTGWRLMHGSTLGKWQYRVFYRNTSEGWQAFRYSVREASPKAIRRAESGNRFDPGQLAEDSYQINLIQVPVLPPGPGVIPVPDDPAEPDQPAHKNGASCPVSPGVDAKYQWEWVPEHFETDENGNEVWVPGHWELKQYTMAFAPTDFCGGN